MSRHETANRAFGSAERPLGRGHHEPERPGHRTVTSEPALDRGVEAAQAVIGELPTRRIGAAEPQPARERADLAARRVGGPEGVAFMAAIDARHGVEQLAARVQVRAAPGFLANRRLGVSERSLENLHHRDKPMQREPPMPYSDPAPLLRATAAVPVSPDRRRASTADVARLGGDRVEQPVDKCAAGHGRRQGSKITLPQHAVRLRWRWARRQKRVDSARGAVGSTRCRRMLHRIVAPPGECPLAPTATCVSLCATLARVYEMHLLPPRSACELGADRDDRVSSRLSHKSVTTAVRCRYLQRLGRCRR